MVCCSLRRRDCTSVWLSDMTWVKSGKRLNCQNSQGGVGEAYLAYAKGERVPNFGETVIRHRMLEAVFNCAELVKREIYETSE